MAGNKKNAVAGSMALLVVVVIAFFIISLFTFENFQPMGMSGVFIQSKYMTYADDAKLEHIFSQTNFVIESSSADIHVRVRKRGYGDQGRVQVFEDANGISFNSLKRTQVDFYEKLVDISSSHRERYAVISIREPKGLVSRTAEVYINLLSDNVVNPSALQYNFILNTGRSRVVFEYDESATDLHINNLYVNGNGSVDVVEPYRAEITNLEINGNSTVKILSKVNGLTKIRANASATLGDINSLTVDGTTNTVSANRIDGNVNFQSNGSLNVTTECTGNVVVKSPENFSISAGIVRRLDVSAPDGRGRESREENALYRLTANVNLNVAKITHGAVVRAESGSIFLGGTGTQTYGSGATAQTVTLGVDGNVDIEKVYGGLTVNFAKTPTGEITNPSVKIRAVNDNINVNYIHGLCDIKTSSAGTANVYVSFMDMVVGANNINIYGSRRPQDQGFVTVTYLRAPDAETGFRSRLTVLNSRKIDVYNQSGSVIPNELENGQLYGVNGGNGDDPLLTIRTQGLVSVKQGTY
jgi:hypothetical protein